MAAAPSVGLRDLTAGDLPNVERWLRDDCVRSAWGDPDANLRLLREPAGPGHWRAIVEADGRAVGLVLWQHPTREELDLADPVVPLVIACASVDDRASQRAFAKAGFVAQRIFDDVPQGPHWLMRRGWQAPVCA